MALPSPSRHGREAVGLRSQGVPGIVGTRGSGHGETSEAVTASSQSQQGRTLGRQEACSPALRPVCSSLWKLPLFIAYLFFFFSWFLFFNFLHRCIGFRRTTARISHNYTYTPSLWHLPPLPPSSHLGHHRGPDWARSAILPFSCLSCTQYCIYVDDTFSICPPLSIFLNPSCLWGL